VTLTQAETNLARVVETDDTGSYGASLLPVGTWRITAHADGFSTAIRENVRLELDRTVRIDLDLTVSPIAESLDVEASASRIQTDSSSLGVIVDRHLATNLPLNGRNLLPLTLLAPGVAPQAPGSTLSAHGGAINVNGAREESNNFLLDGIDNNDQLLNRYVIGPSVEAIREFDIQTSNASAEFGRSGGAQVNVAIRSGSNAFHGAVYEYLRNARLDARNYFDDPAREVPQLQRNEFGGTLGGPILRDRVFFFGAYEGLRLRQAITRLGRVPTVAERLGDFSSSDLNGDGAVDSLDLLRDPLTGNLFPGNRIPAARLDPIGVAVVGLFPEPNRADEVQNIISSPVARLDADQFHVRVDMTPGTRFSAFARYSYSRADRFDPFGPILNTTNLPGFGARIDTRAHAGALAATWLASSSVVNQFRIGFNRFEDASLQENIARDIAGELGIPGLSRDPRTFGVPAINVAGYDAISEASELPLVRDDSTLHVADTLSIRDGRTTWKVGGDLRDVSADVYFGLLSRGIFIFAPVYTGNALADLLLGLPTATIRSRIEGDGPRFRTHALSLFTQADFVAHPSLTLNLGIRYEYSSPSIDANDNGAVFDFDTNSVVRLGSGGVPRGASHPDRNDFAPRIGFAWRVPSLDETVVRGGYGIYYDVTVLNGKFTTSFNPPYFALEQFVTDFQVPLVRPLTLSDPFSSGALAQGAFSPFSIDRNLRNAYVQQWNLTVERELPFDNVVSVSYVGSKGTKLLRRRNANQPLPGTDPDVAARRPLPQFGDITVVESASNSSYHALQVRAERRLGGGLSYLGAYTWSKSLDDTSGLVATAGDGSYGQDHRNLSAERAPSSFDVRHRASIGVVWELPFEGAFGGWQVTGLVTLQSGRPFTPQLSFDNSGAGTNALAGITDRPDLIGDPSIDDPGPDGWFDPAAFAVPTPGTFGSAGRNILTGPPFRSVDLGVAKTVSLAESARFEMRAEVFNLFNSPNFGLPNRFVDQPAAGTISTAGAARQVQLGLRLAF
jgi:hypothetical protein